MNIKELSKNIYEDLNGSITTVDYSDELMIHFQCDDWNNYDETLHFKTTCHEVVESDVKLCEFSELKFTETHPLL